MLDALDVLIGFTLVMLIVSMAVTMLTELIGSSILNLRGRALKHGIARLLALLDRGISRPAAHRLADHLLRNPLVGQPKLTDGHRLAHVLHREELVKLILDFAASGEASKMQAADAEQERDIDDLRAKVIKSLDANGIANPADVLTSIRGATLELEKTSSELSHSARLSIAILHHASSDYLAKLNGWFDQTIDRTSALFTARIRVVTAIVSLAVAAAIQLDAISLINRLAVDDELRATLVENAIEHARRDAPEPPRIVPPAPAESPAEGSNASGGKAAVTNPSGGSLRTDLDNIRKAGFADLEEFGLVRLPSSPQQWVDRWSLWPSDASTPQQAGAPPPVSLFGFLLSAALLSLGAPFWYAALKDLLKLRSLISRKDDDERAERQTNTAPTGPAGQAFTLPADLRGGEAGDLAVG